MNEVAFFAWMAACAAIGGAAILYIGWQAWLKAACESANWAPPYGRPRRERRKRPF